MKRPAAQEKTLARIAPLARDLSRPHHPLDLHRRLSRRDRARNSTFLLDWLDEAELDRVGCFRYEPVAGAAANDLAAAGPGRGEGGALAPLHAAPAGDFGAPPEAQGRHPPAGHHRRGRVRRSPRAAARAMRRRSTARSMSRAAGRCGSARSRPSRSSAPTHTTCTAPPSDFDAHPVRLKYCTACRRLSAEEPSPTLACRQP